MDGTRRNTELDEHYIDERLVALYDPINGEREDVRFYVELAGYGPLDVLDAGCGTGVLALAMADAGHRVVGLDPAAPMLDAARRDDTHGQVQWVCADAREMHLAARFDLITMTGHAFQVFLDDDSMHAFLRRAFDHLRPGGQLAFETRNPLARAWERWTPQLSRRRAMVEGVGEIEWSASTLQVDGEHVTFEMTHRFLGSGEEIITPSTLRFPSQETVRGALESAGFEVGSTYGGWDRSPVTPSSLESIFVARVPA
ncbi:class I SAM-dependent methyltransferase [Arthrobacter tecti]